MDDKNYHSILMKSPFGFAYHKIIVDNEGIPVDYEFLEVNPAFERITGLKAKEIIGKTVCQVLPGIREGNFDCVQYYGDIALNGSDGEFEHYSKQLGSWYKVQAYSDQKHYFSTVFTDTTARKTLSDIAATFNNFSAQTIDLQYLADKAREISGAAYAVLNKFDEDGRGSSTLAFSGMNKHIEKAISILGFDPRGKKWDYDPVRQKKIDSQKTTIFQQISDLTETAIPEKIINLISKTLNMGQVAVVKTTRENIMLGDFTLIFKRGTQLKNRETIETYADLTGMLLSRIDEERKVINEQARLKTITDNMTDLVWESDLQSNNTYASPSVKRILGFSVEEYMLRALEERIAPESLQTALSLMQEELEKENDPHVSKSRSRLIELEYYKKDGSLVPLESNINFIRDKNGKPVGLRGVSRDITERKQAEEKFKTLERQSHAWLENSPACTKIVDLDFNLQYMSSAGIKGLKIDNITPYYGKPYPFHFYPESFKTQMTGSMLKAKETGEVITQEAPVVDINGNEVWFHSTIVPAKDENVRIEYLIIVSMDITERKHAEEVVIKAKEKIEESEYRLLEAQKATKVGSWETDLSNLKVIWSDEIYRIFEINANTFQLSHQAFLNFVHPDDKKIVDDAFAKSFETKAYNSIEHRIITAKNTIKYVVERWKIVFNEQENPTRAIGTCQDITERKQAEELLAKSEDRYNRAISGTGAGLWDWEMVTNTVYFSPQWKKMLGYEDHEIPNDFSGWRKLWHPDEVASNEKAVNDYLEGTSKVYEVEHRLLCKDGSWHWILTRGDIEKDSNGKPIRWTGTNIDITERKQAENELKLQNVLLKTQQEVSIDGILIVNEEDKIVSFNQRFADIWEIPDEIMSLQSSEKALQYVLPKLTNPDEFAQRVHDLYENKQEKSSDEVFLTDGKILERYSTPLIGSDDEYYGRIWYYRDITERKQAERLLQKKSEETDAHNKELKKLNAEKDKFFSIIAHDLKSPFNSIVGFSEILVERVSEKDYDGIAKYARIIQGSSHRAMNLLMNLMEWSRSQTGRMKSNPQQFDLTEFIHSVTPLFDDIAEQKGIVIKKELHPNAMVFADQAMINTVLRNLISNAIKFTKQGGEIILSVTKDKNKCAVSVKDNGIGISKDRVEKLFRIEESESTSGTANEKGTGLGLILCKEFVEKHEEKIWAESEEGKGSTFYFTLPFITETAAETIERQPTPSDSSDGIRKLKILVAEDDKVSEMLIDRHITMCSKEILKVTTGIEAVEVCRNNPDIDLILMDIRMPSMDGYEATRQIREFNKEVIIIAQTAYGLTGDREKSLAAGCNDYIAKPISKVEMLALIQLYFGK